VVGFRQTARRPDADARDVQVFVSVYDTAGKSVASKTTSVTAGLPTGGVNVRFEVLSRIDLKPGRYRLRAAA